MRLDQEPPEKILQLLIAHIADIAEDGLILENSLSTDLCTKFETIKKRANNALTLLVLNLDNSS